MIPAALMPLAYKTAGHAIGLLAFGGIAAAIDVGRGYAIAAGGVLFIAGLFTIRSKIAGVWRIEADGQKARADRLEEILKAERADRATFEKEQLEARHELRAEVARLESQIKVLEAKTDVMAAVEAVKQMNLNAIDAVTAAIREGLEERVEAVTAATRRGLEERDTQTHALLTEIRDLLSPTIPVPQ